MSAPIGPGSGPAATRQRGQAMLLTVLLLGVGVAGLVYTLATPATLSLDADKRTAGALALARDALIGRAAADANMPGSLPCPDFDDGTANILNVADDGIADVLVGNQCPSYIGPLPWRTLGLPDLRDGSGQRLWYALSPAFRDDDSASPLNSDTAGQLTITGTAPANNVIAIVFAPGLVVGAQDRSDATVSLCATTGTNILNSRCPANYLDGANGNGVPPADMTFTTDLPSTTFNDTLLPITSDALFNVVNIRVAKEAIAALEAYRAANSYYPFANNYGTGAPYDCAAGVNRGRLPLTPAGCAQAAWPVGSIMAPGGWFAANNWNLVTHYALSTACQRVTFPPPPPDLTFLAPIIIGLCDSLGSLSGLGGVVLGILVLVDQPITVNGINATPVTARALVIVTGRAAGAQVHPCASEANCMEDLENTNNDTVYQKPSRFPTTNDRMALTCITGTPCAVLP
jgi:hypothetical protein